MKFHPFVLPFSIGLIFLLVWFITQTVIWIIKLHKTDRKKLFKGFFSFKLFRATGEILNESLFHRKMFRVNPMLGYMHMSLALGWFLLILVGNIETRIHSGAEFNPPYFPIFFKFFSQGPIEIPFGTFFSFLMDLLLLFVLSGVVLAIFKRLHSKLFGMKKTTKHSTFDRIALTSLWFIFPLRLLAESISANLYNNGDFLTNPVGNAICSIISAENLILPSWWAYSLSLGIFFITVPFSRYMHIPTEMVLISFRRYGLIPTKEYDVFSEIEVNSCPRCGVCIDKCQLSISGNIHDTQSVYFIKSIRYDKPSEEKTLNCLTCGRCKEYCPVGIHTDNLRITQRVKTYDNNIRNYDYINVSEQEKAEVIYFAGCMTHLTPGIKQAMLKILELSGTKYNFIDRDGSICCGRPLMLAGELISAKKLIQKNTDFFKSTGAKTLVTSCPICFKIFNEDYETGMKVLHHSQYISELIKNNKIHVREQNLRIAYHDPCELGRGSGIYEEPREIIRNCGNLQEAEFEKNFSLCCGSSLGNIQINYDTRDKISAHATEILTSSNPDILATSCPLCKKTFIKTAKCKVMDISEIVATSLIKDKRSEEKKMGELVGGK